MKRLYTASATTPLFMISQFDYRIHNSLKVYLGITTLGQLDLRWVSGTKGVHRYRIRNIGWKSSMVIQGVLDAYKKNPSAFDLDIADCLVDYIQTEILPRTLDIVLKRVHGKKLADIAHDAGVTHSCIDLHVIKFRTSMMPRIKVLLDSMKEAGMDMTKDALKELFADGDMVLLVWDVVLWMQKAQ